MFFQTVFITTAIVGSAIGAALPHPQGTGLAPAHPALERVIPITPFQISNLTAGAVVLSHRNFVNFDVTASPSQPPIHCQALGTTAGKVLSSISRTWCLSPGCSDAAGDEQDNQPNPPATATTPSANTTSEVWWFSWTMQSDDGDGGAELRVGRRVDAHCREEAVHFIPREEMPVVGKDTMFARQVYTGPEMFEVEAWRFEEVED
ncbi:hypothetical protein MFIFM68171_00997 [Madurella fahalii]|uniref:Uncharacterized protein n=1 Tax=Madurella fahalii TaxID=1157608 RepID=A0ABQ0FZ55_9PEZI